MPLVDAAIPHACEAPVVSEVSVPTADEAMTFWGAALRMLVPFANCPNRFRPQHQVVPASVRAQANSLPAEMAVGLFTLMVTGV